MVGLVIAALRGIVLTRWLGVLALVAAAGNTVALTIGATLATKHGVVWVSLGWFGMTTFVVLLVAASIVILGGPEAVRHPVASPTKATVERRGAPVTSTHQ